jgi:hypothetical protein
MATPFTAQNTPALTKIVETALDGSYGAFEAMRNGLKKSLGMPSQSEEMAQLPPAGTVQELSLPAAEVHQGQPTFEEIIYPSGNDRYVISGYSQAEVDQKIARIKAALGVQ